MKKVRLLLWAALLVAGVGAYAAFRLNASDELTRGKLGTVPAFALQDQLGRSVTDRDLLGQVWVANFVFTRCPSVCPMLTAKFQAFQRDLGAIEGVRFVSFSVDPEYDTPDVLKAYAERFEANPERWRFLTGPLDTIEKTVVEGFKVHVGEATPHPENPTLVDIMHGEHFVLVDREGQLRGYYRADKAGLSQLAEDTRDLIR
jgi:protein SCO1/2